MALLRGRERAVPQDVYDVAYDILNAPRAVLPGTGRGVHDRRRPRRAARRFPLPGRARGRSVPASAAYPTQPAPTVHRCGRDATARPAGRSAGRAMTSRTRCRSRPAGTAPPHRARGEPQGLRPPRRSSSLAGARPRCRARRSTTVRAGRRRPPDGLVDPCPDRRTARPGRDPERDLDVAVLVDRSGSLDFGTVGWRKADLAVSVASAVSALAVLGGDRIGAVVATADGPGSCRSAAVDGIWRAPGQRRAVTARRSISVAPSTASDTSCEAGSRSWSRTSSLPRHLEPGAGAARTPKRGHRRRGRRPARAPTPDVGLLVIEDPRPAASGRSTRATSASASAWPRSPIVAAPRGRLRSGERAPHLRLRTDTEWTGPLAACLYRHRRARALGGAASHHRSCR